MKKLLGISAAVLGLIAFSGAAQAQTIVYQDNFGYSAPTFAGSSPDTVNTGGATWQNGPNFDPNAYYVYGGAVAVYPGSYAFTDAALPVNSLGGAGVSGTTNFTVSAVMTPGAEGTAAVLNLYNGTPNADFATLADLQVFNGFASYNGNYQFGLSNSGTTLVGIIYNASTTTLSFDVGGTLTAGGTISGGTIIGTQLVTAAQINALTGVGFGFSDYSNYSGPYIDPTATANQFTLSENLVVPEPSTVWLFALGFAGLVFQIQRKRLSKV